MLSDDLSGKKNCRKGLNFGKWASFHLRNIALKLFWLGCSLVSRMDVYKKGKQVGKAKCFLHAQYLENKANLSVKTMGHEYHEMPCF